MLTIHALDPIPLGATRNVLVSCDNPGVVSLTYGAGLTGPATVTIEGTRVWTPDNTKVGQGFFAPAAASAIMIANNDVTLGFEIDLRNAHNFLHAGGVSYDTIFTIVRNYLSNIANNVSWGLWLRQLSGYQIFLEYGTAGGSGYAQVTIPYSLTAQKLRMCIVLPVLAGTTFAYRYKVDSAAIVSGNLGVVGGASKVQVGSPFTLFKNCERFFYAPAALSTAQQDLFLNDLFPSDPCTVQYATNEEDASHVYDLSGNDYDSEFGLDANAPATVVNRTYTDSAPVTPYALVAVTAVATTGTTIDATRPRQGVPARASEGERIESAAQCVVTVNDPVGAVGPVINARIKIL